MGLKPWEFWRLTFGDYQRLVYHHAKQAAESLHIARLTGAFSLMAMSGKLPKLEQLMPLWIDNIGPEDAPKKAFRPMSNEEFDKYLTDHPEFDK